MKCLFCKIIKKEIPAEIILEDDLFLAIKDIHPKAPIHILVLPKKHIVSAWHLKKADALLAGKLILFANSVAQKSGIAKGYKLVFNVGRDGGQLIDHLHLHVLGGWKNDHDRDFGQKP
jgi:histidine triad (HIT) family protein